MTDFDISKLSQLDRDRLSAYKSNLDFYSGSQWAQKSKNRQLVFNYAKIAVDKITSYLMNELNYSLEPVKNVIARSEAPRQPINNGVIVGNEAT